MSNRRLSMAERRSSMSTPDMANFSPQPLERRPSVVPHLAGLEKPIPDTIPDQCDVVIAGTGLTESILAAALAWQGSNVLHIDNNDYYGDTTATLTIDQLKTWVGKVNKREIHGYKDAVVYIPGGNEIKSRDYGIDLTPKVLFAKSDLLSLLIDSKVYKYLEFLPLSSLHFYEDDNFEKINNTKQDIFTNQTLSLVTKRSLMKFIKFVINYENELEIWKDYKKESIEKFLNEKFKFEKNQLFELIFSIGLCQNLNVKTPEALARIKRYLISFDVYGNFPIMYSKYGGAGEISQGFCRSAAVAGTTYKLNTKLTSYDSTTKIAKFSDNSKVLVNEKIVLSPSQVPIENGEYEIQRLTVIVKKDCKEWFENGENAAIVVFPTGSLPNNNKEAVQVIIMGEGSGITTSDTCVWYLSTVEKNSKGRYDLENALKLLEKSILRESSNNIIENEEIFNDGVLNSVKLGESFKDFVPIEKIQYLLKLYYVQFTNIPHQGIVNPEIIKSKIQSIKDYSNKSINPTNLEDDSIIFSTLPSSEISYDGVITVAKVLYERIVGSDDDFFDVDFEDDDDDHDHHDDDYDGYNHRHKESAVDDNDPVEFADDMEL